ncbi:MAG: hypothetical protein DMD61_00095 [Gemmatimonadetes bacterium]|nr:MAG: hypothetical protein DMD61_00095 [Gemmatimonadota bacterium]
MQSHDVVFGGLKVAVGRPASLGLARGLADPFRGGEGSNGRCARREQIEGPVGDVQLVDRVRDNTLRGSLLGLADSGGVNQGGRGGAERGVELLGHPMPHRDVQTAAQDPEDREQNPDVPRGQPPADSSQGIHQGPLTRRTGSRSRAVW